MEAKEIIITEIGNGIAYYQELHDWVKGFDIDPDDEYFEPLSLLEGDPDIVKCEGQDKLYFCTVELEGKKFVLTSDETSPQQKEMLKKFHIENWKEHYSATESTWDDFRNLPNTIAYRGGEGYTYTIWNYISKAS